MKKLKTNCCCSQLLRN